MIQPNTRLEEALRNAPQELKTHYAKILTESPEEEPSQPGFLTNRELIAELGSLPKSVTHSSGWDDLDRMCSGGLAEGEVALLAAQAGVGKTHFAINLAVNYAMRDLPVFYLSMEDGWKMILQRFHQLDPTGSHQDNVFMVHEDEITLKNAISVLKSATENAKLIVIDNLFALPLRQNAKGDYWTSQAEWVDDVCNVVRSSPCSALILHHLNKSPYKDSAERYQIAGSTRIVNRVAQVWMLARSEERPNMVALKTAKNRRQHEMPEQKRLGECFLQSDSTGKLRGVDTRHIPSHMESYVRDVFKLEQ